MIELGCGPVHLSYGPGAGATTLCLSISSTILECGNRVLWIATEIPDPERSSHILGHLGEGQLMRLTIFERKDSLETSITATRSIVERLDKEDLLVIDDWCERHGRASSDDVAAILRLIQSRPRCRMIITSALVSKPISGSMAVDFTANPRGGKKVNDLLRVVFLYDDAENLGYRNLFDSGKISRVLLTDSGFIPA